MKSFSTSLGSAKAKTTAKRQRNNNGSALPSWPYGFQTVTAYQNAPRVPIDISPGPAMLLRS
jgi:hypothetical protein